MRFIRWILERLPQCDLRRTIAIAICYCCVIPVAQAQDETRFERHKYVAALPDIGTVTLELREEFQGKRRADLTWVFQPVAAHWELKDGKRLDTTGKYTTLLAEITKEFPPAPNSALLGKWSNKRDGFSTVAFILTGDGTGYMGAAVTSLPILWKPEGPDTLRMVIVGPNGPMKDQPIILHYDAIKDVLTIDKNTTKSPINTGQDPSPFYRLQN